MPDIPETRYAKSGDTHIAYQVFGSGSLDLVYVPGFVSHLELQWQNPRWSHMLQRLGSFARVIMFDKPGTGMSDRLGAIPTLEQRIDDVRAVMEAVGSERAAFFGVSEGGPMSILSRRPTRSGPRRWPSTAPTRDGCGRRTIRGGGRKPR